MNAQDLAGVRWIKSSFSGHNGECVELAGLDDGHIALRNSNRPQDGVILFTRAEIAAWLQGAKHGEFDHLT
ncbi:MAG TPA: DUF397 domain-containing protein [Streptosporangiaceae bacterium]|nr:DUF397 domain-containing protein [Streptosporangiaceae bacterium]